MSVKLLVRSKANAEGEGPQELLLAEDSIVIGRDKPCAVVLADAVISRRHATIVREGALYFLEDLNSSYGTRVNGATLPAGEKRLLRNGDLIAVGPYDVVFDRQSDESRGGTGETSVMAKKVLKGLDGAGSFVRVMNGPLEGKRIEIRDAQEVIIGRDDDVDLQLNDDLVSRRHAKIRRDWTGTSVEDLQSRNGVKVNKKKITNEPLKDRDEIQIGSTRLLYVDPTEVHLDAEGEPDASESSGLEEEPASEESSAAEEGAQEGEGEGAEEGEASEGGEENADGVSEGAEEHPEGEAPQAGEDVGYPEEPPPPDGMLGGLSARVGIDLGKLLPLIVVGGIAVVALVVFLISILVT